MSRVTIQTPSADLSYLDVGNPHAPTALFVHGVGTNSLFWRDLNDRLAGDDRRGIAFDWPIHGQSPARAEQDLSLGALADLIDEFCTALDLGEVDLVAHDTGGAIAQIFAARYPDRLRTFTLTNCDTHDNVPPDA